MKGKLKDSKNVYLLWNIKDINIWRGHKNPLTPSPKKTNDFICKSCSLHLLHFGGGVLAVTWMWRSEHSLAGVFFSFHLLGARDQIQFARLGRMPFCLPGCLVGLVFGYVPSRCVLVRTIFFPQLSVYTCVTQPSVYMLLHVHSVVVHTKDSSP